MSEGERERRINEGEERKSFHCIEHRDSFLRGSTHSNKENERDLFRYVLRLSDSVRVVRFGRISRTFIDFLKYGILKIFCFLIY